MEAPIRTYTTVLHGQQVVVKVFATRQPMHVAWVGRTAGRSHEGQALYVIDNTVAEDPYVPNPRPRKPVDLNDWEE